MYCSPEPRSGGDRYDGNRVLRQQVVSRTVHFNSPEKRTLESLAVGKALQQVELQSVLITPMKPSSPLQGSFKSFWLSLSIYQQEPSVKLFMHYSIHNVGKRAKMEDHINSRSSLY